MHQNDHATDINSLTLLNLRYQSIDKDTSAKLLATIINDHDIICKHFNLDLGKGI